MHRKYGNIHALDSHLNNYGGDMDGSIKNVTRGFKKSCSQVTEKRVQRNNDYKNLWKARATERLC